MYNINDVTITLLISTMVILLLIAGVIIIMILGNRKRVQQEVKMAQLQVDYEKELRLVESEVQEQTLTNVSRELHDNIGQLLTLIRLQLEQETIDDEEMATRFEPMDKTITDTIDQVRLLSHSLNTDHLEQAGLAAAVSKEITRIKQIKSINIHWQYDDTEPTVGNDQKIMVFRIFQELLNNALKHARAKNLHITLSGSNGFHLSIEDDGKGFDVAETLNSGKGTGLLNMLKRAKLANLSLDIKSTKDKGSIFTLSQHSHA